MAAGPPVCYTANSTGFSKPYILYDHRECEEVGRVSAGENSRDMLACISLCLGHAEIMYQDSSFRDFIQGRNFDN